MNSTKQKSLANALTVVVLVIACVLIVITACSLYLTAQPSKLQTVATNPTPLPQTTPPAHAESETQQVVKDIRDSFRAAQSCQRVAALKKSLASEILPAEIYLGSVLATSMSTRRSTRFSQPKAATK